MKELKRKTLIVLGLIIATIALINNFGFAGTIINSEDLNIEMQIEKIALDLDEANVEDEVANAMFKIYNSANQLVYETYDKKDDKLIQLIKTSDFITEVNKISYYKLSR